ncbi:hypothetical protein glysoja_024650 [Glycine soja]|uniref:Uncharacterized protein n=1 Tax=Glycine soja TaxID=3848 RepID=A0A0B2PDU6_GLYSO|nr:hypothetical protein glysoja_024650 [Glycine soja]
MLTIMASRKNHFTSRSHRFLPVASDIHDSVSLTMDLESAFEFDESEIYNSARANNSFEFRRSLHGRGSNSSAKKKPARRLQCRSTSPTGPRSSGTSTGGRTTSTATTTTTTRVTMMRGVGGCHRTSFLRGIG